MATTGFTTAGTGTSVTGPATQESSPNWSTPGNVTADDVAVSSTDMRDDPGTNSEYLKGTNFGFALPAGATIDGIEARFQCNSSDAPGSGNRYVAELTARIFNEAGVVEGDNKSDTADWPAAVTTKTYGGAADLWSGTFSDTDVEDIDFGFGVVVIFPSDADRGQGSVDVIEMNIHYTESSTTITLAGADSLAVSHGVPTITARAVEAKGFRFRNLDGGKGPRF